PGRVVPWLSSERAAPASGRRVAFRWSPRAGSSRWPWQWGTVSRSLPYLVVIAAAAAGTLRRLRRKHLAIDGADTVVLLRIDDEITVQAAGVRHELRAAI